MHVGERDDGVHSGRGVEPRIRIDRNRHILERDLRELEKFRACIFEEQVDIVVFGVPHDQVCDLLPLGFALESLSHPYGNRHVPKDLASHQIKSARVNVGSNVLVHRFPERSQHPNAASDIAVKLCGMDIVQQHSEHSCGSG